MGNKAKRVNLPLQPLLCEFEPRQRLALHQTAAEFLAYAALSLFPNTQLLGGLGTSRYFYYDFHFPFPLDKQSLAMVEERMVRLLKTHQKVEKREMLSSNAANLFASRGQILIAEKLRKNHEKLIQICAIADFLDYCPHPFSQTWSFLPHLKLFDMEKLPSHAGQIIRIIGSLASDKNALKIFIKQNPSPVLFNHIHFAVDEKLFLSLEEGLWSWLPKGEIIRQLLLDLWHKKIICEKFKLIATPYSALSSNPDRNLLHYHQECFSQSGCDKLAEIAYFTSQENTDYLNGLFETKGAFTDRLTLFFSDENFLEICISSLHFILEIPKILGFEFQIVLGHSIAKGSQSSNTKRTSRFRLLQDAVEKTGLSYIVEKDNRAESEIWIQIKLFDALGRLWNGPFMSVPAKTKRPILVCSAFGAMERLVGLILERYAGNLPLWLAPEQVRLIPLSKEARLYASQIHQALEIEKIRSEIDEQAASLSHRLYRANIEKVPFAVIIGDKELKDQTLVVRTHGLQQEERMNVSALCERIKNSQCGVGSEPEN